MAVVFQTEHPKIIKQKLSSNNLTAIIGDIHECVDELKTLVDHLKSTYKNIKLYSLGDWIDKGGKTKEIIDYLLVTNINLLIGNHERYIYNHINSKDFKYEENAETNYFTSLKFFSENPDYIPLFNELYKKSAHSYVFTYSDNSGIRAIITHAPCEKTHLGRSNVDIRNLVNRRFNWENPLPIASQLNHLFEEDTDFLHIFGHVELDLNTCMAKNRIGVDHGCVSGGYLTALLLNDHIVNFVSVKSLKVTDTVFNPLTYHKE